LQINTGCFIITLKRTGPLIRGLGAGSNLCLVKTFTHGCDDVNPLAAALLKLAPFVMWARPTYKMTVDMYERRDRRLGMLPEKKESLDKVYGRTGFGDSDGTQTRKK
jgi:hypothetical protein